VTVEITVRGGTDEDSVLGLFDRVSYESELTGAVRLRSGPLEPGALGAASDVLVVALSSGAAATALARVLIAWLRTRRSNVTLRINDVEFEGEQLRPEAVEALVRTLAAKAMPQVDD
jgi:hypothetical protein